MPNISSNKVIIGQTVELTQDSEDYIALKCAIRILGGGMTDRLMHVVRGLRGLGTYGIYANLQNISPKTYSIFCIEATFSPNSIHKGLECTTEIVQKWHSEGVSTSELETAKDSMVGSRIIASDSVDELHDMLLPHILKGDACEKKYYEFNDSVRTLTLEKVNNAIKTHINPNALVQVLVQPK